MDDIKENYFYDKTIKIIKLMLVFVLIILLTGFSYSFFVYNKTGLYTHTITGGKMSIIYNETTGNNITIDNAYPLRDEEAVTQGLEFEFTITGYNESDKNIYYAIVMDYGEDISDKERFKDTDLKLSLLENEEEVFENEVFDNLDNQNIHYGYISQGTSSETPTTNSYKLKIWINDNVIISDTISNDLSTWTDFEWDFLEDYNKSVYNSIMNSDSPNLSDYGISIYTTSEFQKMYANFKVNVTADLTYDDIGYVTYDANGGEFTPKKTSLTTNRITLQKPVMEGKGFLGWSSTPNGEVEYYSGDTYNGEYDVLYAIYSDTRNVMNTFPTTITNVKTQITEVHFINDTQSNIDERYNESSIKADLTYNSQGSVKGWLEEDYYDDATSKQYYKLYVGSEGTTYLNTGNSLFEGLSKVITIDFNNVDTSEVTDMSRMFFKCGELTELDFSNFDTSNVTDMSMMFTMCGGLISLDLSSFDTKNVNNMGWMFQYCSSMVSIDLSSFDTSNVTNMQSMFYFCNLLERLDISNFNTSGVIDSSYMFYYNIKLNTIYSNYDWNSGLITADENMFTGCTSLIGAVPYDSTKADITMANPDTGYFTRTA